MAEFISLEPDRTFLVYAANTGTDSNDGDRRHIFRVPVDRAAPRAVTTGCGIEWTPLVTGDGALHRLHRRGQRDAAASRRGAGGGRDAAAARAPSWSRDFPAADGGAPAGASSPRPTARRSTASCSSRRDAPARRPRVVFVHGGPPRQMLLGWHYMDYYTHAYAVNQYFASHGYVVLSRELPAAASATATSSIIRSTPGRAARRSTRT